MRFPSVQPLVLTFPNKKELQFTLVYYTSKLWCYGTLIYYGKLWYDGKKNYGTMDKTMEKTMVLWTKLWYYGQNYGTMDNTMVLC